MNQKNLLYLIILDCVIMLFSLGVIILRYQAISNVSIGQTYGQASESSSVPEPKATQKTELCLPILQTKTAPNENDIGTPNQTQDTSKKSDNKTRNIAFTYRSSHAKKVEIIGDFNGWVPQPLIKGAENKWSITLQIPPSDYAYNLVVDGKPIRDPNNPKTCNIGRGFTNSYLKVRQPLVEKNKDE